MLQPPLDVIARTDINSGKVDNSIVDAVFLFLISGGIAGLVLTISARADGKLNKRRWDIGILLFALCFGSIVLGWFWLSVSVPTGLLGT